MWINRGLIDRSAWNAIRGGDPGAVRCSPHRCSQEVPGRDGDRGTGSGQPCRGHLRGPRPDPRELRSASHLARPQPRAGEPVPQPAHRQSRDRNACETHMWGINQYIPLLCCASAALCVFGEGLQWPQGSSLNITDVRVGGGGGPCGGRGGAAAPTPRDQPCPRPPPQPRSRPWLFMPRSAP